MSKFLNIIKQNSFLKRISNCLFRKTTFLIIHNSSAFKAKIFSFKILFAVYLLENIIQYKNALLCQNKCVKTVLKFQITAILMYKNNFYWQKHKTSRYSYPDSKKSINILSFSYKNNKCSKRYHAAFWNNFPTMTVSDEWLLVNSHIKRVSNVYENKKYYLIFWCLNKKI